MERAGPPFQASVALWGMPTFKRCVNSTDEAKINPKNMIRVPLYVSYLGVQVPLNTSTEIVYRRPHPVRAIRSRGPFRTFSKRPSLPIEGLCCVLVPIVACNGAVGDYSAVNRLSLSESPRLRMLGDALSGVMNWTRLGGPVCPRSGRDKAGPARCRPSSRGSADLRAC